MSQRRKLGRLTWSASLALAILLALVVCAAHARADVVSGGGFGSEGRGAGEMSKPGGIAVSADGGDVYVADTQNQRIDEFSAKGEFVRAWGWGVRTGASALETCTEECFQGLSGNGAGELNEPVAVAVAPGGDVYVLDRGKGDGRIQRFGTSGATVTYKGTLPARYGKETAERVGFTYPLPFGNDIAVSPDGATAGTVYVGDNAEGGPRVIPFGPTGKAGTPIPVALGTIAALATAPGGRLYVAGREGAIAVIEGGAETGKLEPGLGEIDAIAVDAETGNLLVEPNRFEEDSSENTVLLLTELAPTGESIRNLRETNVAQPQGSEPPPFGLAVNPVVQIEASESGPAYAPGAIYVVNRRGGSVDILVEQLPGAPFIEDFRVAPSGSEDAALSTQVSPRGEETHVYFRYGTTTSYGSTVPVPPGADIGAGFAGVVVQGHLADLLPGTTYHVEAVAENASGTVLSEDRTFTTPETAVPSGLPDRRVWEQVTTEKGNAEIELEGGGVAALEGGAVSFLAPDPLPGSPSGALDGAYVAVRTPGGWHTVGVSPPTRSATNLLQGPTSLFSRDLARSVSPSLLDLTGTAPPNQNNLYLRETASGAETLLTTGALEGNGTNIYGASADLSHIAFTSSAHLTPDTPPGAGRSLYEFSGGSLHDVGILPGASSPTGGEVEERSYLREPGLVSEDGRRIFFTTDPAPDEAGETVAPQVFVRIDGSRTVEVSASQATTPEAEPQSQAATFDTASADGRYVFFTSSAELTDDAYTGEPPEGGGTKESPNLYRYDVETGNLLDLSVTDDTADARLGADVVPRSAFVDRAGVVAYFVASGDLAGGATSGRENLYRWTPAGGVVFVATPAEGDPLSQPGFGFSFARVDTDGSVVAFSSQTALDPAYPNAAGVFEIYRYSVGNPIVCVSCSASATEQQASQITHGSFFTSNALSADGSRIFFETNAALVPTDTNGVGDVYEWEGGSAHLLSSGTGRTKSTFLDASSTGADAFFITNARLVPGDTDEYADVYDARENGGLPSAPAAPSVPCEGESCRAPAGAAPAPAAGGSRTFQGPADPRPHRHHKKKHRRRHRHHKGRTGHRHGHKQPGRKSAARKGR